MKKQLNQVKEFHLACGIYSQENPNVHIPEAIKAVRKVVLEEEVKELYEAVATENIIESAKELADVMYCVLGTVHALGLAEKFEEIFDEVHKSNMSKLDENGKPVVREDGKILKSTLYTEPNIKKILEE